MSVGGARLRAQRLAANLGNPMVWGMAVSTVPTLIGKVRGFLIIPVIARILGIEAYGVWVQVWVVTQILSLLGGMGLQTALVRFYPGHRKHGQEGLLLSTVAAMATASSVALAAGVWFAAPALSAMVGNGFLTPALLRLAAPLVPLLAIQMILVSWFRARNEIRRYALAKSVYGVAELLAVVAAVLAFQSLEALVLSMVAVLLAFDVWMLQHHLRGTPLLSFRSFSPRVARTTLRYALPVLPTQFAQDVSAYGDRLLIGVFLGSAAVGVYSIVYALVQFAVFFQTAVVDVLFPKLAHLRESGAVERGARLLRLMVGVVAAGGLLLLGVLYGLRGWLWNLLAGRAEALAAPPIGALLLIAGLGVVSYAVARVLLLEAFTTDRTVLTMVLFTVTAALNVGGNLLLIPRYGLVGATLATLGAYVALLLATAVSVRHVWARPAPAGQGVPAP